VKIYEMLPQLSIALSNEEAEIMSKISSAVKSKHNFNEHEQVVIENLVKKSLIQKINNNGHIYFKKNELSIN